jgi:hypothetical protein
LPNPNTALDTPAERTETTAASAAAQMTDNHQHDDNHKGVTTMVLNETYTLSNDVQIPKLGLGTWFIDDDKAAQAVRDAITIGYRNIDTAQAYGNERGVRRRRSDERRGARRAVRLHQARGRGQDLRRRRQSHRRLAGDDGARLHRSDADPQPAAVG